MNELIKGWTEFTVEVGTNSYRDVRYRVYRNITSDTVFLDLYEGGVHIDTIEIEKSLFLSDETFETLIRQRLVGST